MVDVTEQTPLVESDVIEPSFSTEAAVLLRYAIPSAITFLLEQSIQLATIFSVGTPSFQRY